MISPQLRQDPPSRRQGQEKTSTSTLRTVIRWASSTRPQPITLTLFLAFYRRSLVRPRLLNGIVYYGGVNDLLKAFPVANSLLATTPASHSSATFPYPGTTPGIAERQQRRDRLGRGKLFHRFRRPPRAYDAASLSHEFYNSKQARGFGNGISS
jgi:hypothetical protein